MLKFHQLYNFPKGGYKMNKLLAKEYIQGFLKEDVGTGDLSTDIIFGNEIRGEGYFLAKDNGYTLIQENQFPFLSILSNNFLPLIL